jgi:hypothetical protein
MPEIIALVGSGPVGLGFVKGLAESANPVVVSEFHIFDISEILGAGTAYDPSVTEPTHLLNGRAGHLPKDFYDWINGDAKDVKNRVEIEAAFRRLFEKRLEQKFFKVFGIKYDAKATYAGEQKDLCDHYGRLWESYKKRYLHIEPEHLASRAEIHPRMLYGLYAIAQFEMAIAALEAKGIKVVRHTKSEVTSLTKRDDGKLVLGFNGAELTVDSAFVASGPWFNIPPQESSRDFKKIWPISELVENVEAAIAEEIAERKAQGNPNDEFVLVIEGKGLSAADVAKTLLGDGIMEEGEDGNLIYIPNHFNGYRIKIVMVSRTPLMHKVFDNEVWWSSPFFRDTGTFKTPPGLMVEKEDLRKFAEEQGGKIHLWQIAVMTVRAIEIGYKTAGDHAAKTGDTKGSEMAALRIKQVREILHALLANVKKDAAGDRMLTKVTENNAFFDSLDGDSITQLKAIMGRFNLQLEGANYVNIVAMVNQFAGFGANPWQQLATDLHYGTEGDVGKSVVWKSILPSMINTSFLPKEEAAFHGQTMGRIIEVIMGMPPLTARELLAFHKAGVLEMATLGKDYTKSFLGADGTEISADDRKRILQEMRDAKKSDAEIAAAMQDKKIIFRRRDGETVVCDICINATGRNYSLTGTPPPLFKSMYEQGIIEAAPRILWYKNDEEYEAKKAEMLASFGPENTASIFSLLTRDEDGKWYTAPKGMNVQHDHAVDKKGDVTTPNLFILNGGGIYASIEYGKGIALKFLRGKMPPAPSPAYPANASKAAESEVVIQSTA